MQIYHFHNQVMCTVMGSSSANYSVERCHIFHIIWAPKVGSLVPLHFYQFMISVKFGLVFPFIHSLLSNSLTTDRTSVEYFTRTCSDWLTWRWRTNYSLLVRLVSPKIVSFKRSQMIELESLTPFFLFRYYQPSSKTAYSSIQTWISDWHSG